MLSSPMPMLSWVQPVLLEEEPGVEKTPEGRKNSSRSMEVWLIVD